MKLLNKWMWLVAVSVLLLGGLARGEEPLSQERWRSDGHGVSLRPPLGARVVEQTADDAVVRIAGKPPYVITVFVRNSEKEVDLARVQQLAIEQMFLVQPNAIILEQKDLQIDGRPGLAMYFKVPVDKKPIAIIAQSFVMIDELTVLMVQLETAHADLPALQPVYEALLQSVQIKDPALTAKERADAVQRFTKWFARIDGPTLRKGIVPQQWMRLLEGSTDIGYMLIEQRPDTAMELPGLRVDVQARVQVANQYYDSISTFFSSDDLTHEVWSIRTTVRPLDRQLSPEEEHKNSWAETGVRSKGAITVTRESAEGKKEFKWDEPAVYVPQVAMYLIGPMLPRDGEVMGFYSYYPNNGKIGYRTERVTTTSSGFQLHSQPSPEQPVQVSEFDKQGRLLKRTLGGQRVLVAATPAEIKARWKLK